MSRRRPRFDRGRTQCSERVARVVTDIETVIGLIVAIAMISGFVKGNWLFSIYVLINYVLMLDIRSGRWKSWFK